MDDIFLTLDDYLKRIKKGPIILDNIIPNNILDTYVTATQTQVSWALSDFNGTSPFTDEFLREIGSKRTYEQFQFVSTCLNQTNGPQYTFSAQDMENYHLWSLPLTLGLLKINLSTSIKHIIRIKANFQTRAPKISKDKFNFPHCDLDQSHKDVFGPFASTAILYLNDCDGDTYFFKENAYEISDKSIPYEDWLNSLTILKQISPKQGRLVIFPSGMVHAGSHPIENDYRMVVNFNFIPKSCVFSNAKDYYEQINKEEEWKKIIQKQ